METLASANNYAFWIVPIVILGTFLVLWWLGQTLCNHDNALTEIPRPEEIN